jgi:hypothetical protein
VTGLRAKAEGANPAGRVWLCGGETDQRIAMMHVVCLALVRRQGGQVAAVVAAAGVSLPGDHLQSHRPG